MLIVAEIGLNHDGSFEIARELIRLAKWAGADVAKFQFGWRAQPGEMNHWLAGQAQAVKAWCDYVGIEMFGSVITEEGLEIADSIGVQRYKIASRTVADRALCERVLSRNKPTYVSLGMWDGADFPLGAPDGKMLSYIYCRSKYPTAPSDLVALPERFSPSGFYGYSDHALGIEACLLAIARGARYIEKHFTLNKASQLIRDHVLSATPDELRQLVDVGRPLARLAAEMPGFAE